MLIYYREVNTMKDVREIYQELEKIKRKIDENVSKYQNSKTPREEDDEKALQELKIMQKAISNSISNMANFRTEVIKEQEDNSVVENENLSTMKNAQSLSNSSVTDEEDIVAQIMAQTLLNKENISEQKKQEDLAEDPPLEPIMDDLLKDSKSEVSMHEMNSSTDTDLEKQLINRLMMDYLSEDERKKLNETKQPSPESAVISENEDHFDQFYSKKQEIPKPIETEFSIEQNDSKKTNEPDDLLNKSNQPYPLPLFEERDENQNLSSKSVNFRNSQKLWQNIRNQAGIEEPKDDYYEEIEKSISSKESLSDIPPYTPNFEKAANSWNQIMEKATPTINSPDYVAPIQQKKIAQDNFNEPSSYQNINGLFMNDIYEEAKAEDINKAPWSKEEYISIGNNDDIKNKSVPVKELISDENQPILQKNNTKKPISGIVTKIRKSLKNMDKEIKVRIGVIAATLILGLTSVGASELINNRKESKSAKATTESVSENDVKNTDLEKEIEKSLNDLENPYQIKAGDDIVTKAENVDKTSSQEKTTNETEKQDTTSQQSNQSNDEKESSPENLTILEDENIENKEESFIKIGGNIKLNEGTRIYNNEYDAYLGENSYSAYYKNTDKRVILGVAILNENGMNQIYASDELANQKIDELIKNGGEVVSILTANQEKYLQDYDGSSPLINAEINAYAEGWYNVNDIANQNVKGMQR